MTPRRQDARASAKGADGTQLSVNLTVNLEQRVFNMDSERRRIPTVLSRRGEALKRR